MSLANLIKTSQDQLSQIIMELYKKEIFVDILSQTKIGKTLKLFIDFCNRYSPQQKELILFQIQADYIMKKWKNYINNYLFGED